MKILTIAEYYLPGYKGGGPIRTIVNMVERMGDEFEFLILTQDRDLGDTQPYPNIITGEWVKVGKAKVRYLTPEEMRLMNWGRLMDEIEHDVLYLNSFFATMCVKIMFARWLRQLPPKPLIIAPRGEFYAGALALKAYKKRPYLWLTRAIGMYKNIIWQASTDDEAQTIKRNFPQVQVQVAGVFPRSQVYVARDLITPPEGINAVRLDDDDDNDEGKEANPHIKPLKIVFISRIAQKKNLDDALRILAQVRGDVPIRFDIYGPQEDPEYWTVCADLMQSLPPNVQAAYKGPLNPGDIVNTFNQYHLFLFPTHGENFGHVIWEALAAGCTVLTSTQTPWLELEARGAGWALPLEPLHAYVEKIQELMTVKDWFIRRQAARDYAHVVANDTDVLEANRRLFLNTLHLYETKR